MTNRGGQIIQVITLSDDEEIDPECTIIEKPAMVVVSSVKRTPLAEIVDNSSDPAVETKTRNVFDLTPNTSKTRKRRHKIGTAPMAGRLKRTCPPTPTVESPEGGKTVRRRGRPRKVVLDFDEENDKPEKTDKNYTETFPVLTVVRTDFVGSYQLNPRVEVVGPNFVPKVPKVCTEAIRAAKHGSFMLRHKWPGVPNRKFSTADLHKHGTELDDWPVQAIYYTEKDEFLVYYEGWTCQSLSHQPAEYYVDTASEMLKMATIRRKFLEARKELALLEAAERVRIAEKTGKETTLEKEMDSLYVHQDPADKRRNPHQLFWLFEDLTHFHTIANKQIDMGAVMYMACTKYNPRPPYYAYTPINIVDTKVYDECLLRPANKNIIDLIGTREYCVLEKTETVCSSDKSCLCDIRFNLLFHRRHVQNLKYRSDATLDFTDFNIDKKRVVMECSEVCGCDWKCPRRQLQRGQQIPLVVYYESHKKGYGLRAAEHIPSGSLVCEYTGELLLLPETEWSENCRRVLRQHTEEDEDESVGAKDTSYETSCGAIDDRLVICALNCGSVARFINHSCSPNTVFVEVYSRRFEADPLVPRIAVYATQDIAIGHEITVAYWTHRERDLTPDSGIRCQCNSENCMKTLPG